MPGAYSLVSEGKLSLLRGDWNCSHICNTLGHIRSNCPLYYPGRVYTKFSIRTRVLLNLVDL
jgi:hypothetical protein